MTLVLLEEGGITPRSKEGSIFLRRGGEMDGTSGWEVLKNAAVGVEPTAKYKNHNSKMALLTTHPLMVIDYIVVHIIT